MRRHLTTPAILAAALLGCQAEPTPAPAPTPTPDAPAARADVDRLDQSQARPPATRSAGPAVASVDTGEAVVRLDRAAYLDFLEQTRGLDAVLQLMQLELARHQARELGVDLAAVDVEAETRRTLDAGFRGPAGERLAVEDYDAAIDRLLGEQGLSRAEFDVVMETNALLRAAAEPEIERRLTDEVLRKEFDRRYGARLEARVISVETLPEAQAVVNRLEAGEDFVALAREVNDDPDLAARAGLLEPFSWTSTLPQALKVAAFSLGDGEVSNPIESDGRYVLLRVEGRLPPAAVEYERVRDELRRTLVGELSGQVAQQYRQLLARTLASDALEINDPTLREQFDERLAAQQPRPTDADELRRRMEAQRPTTAPARPTID